LPVEVTTQPPAVKVLSAFAANPLMWVLFKMSTGIFTAGGAGGVGVGAGGLAEVLAADGVGGTKLGAADELVAEDATDAAGLDGAAGALEVRGAAECVALGRGDFELAPTAGGRVLSPRQCSTTRTPAAAITTRVSEISSPTSRLPLARRCCPTVRPSAGWVTRWSGLDAQTPGRARPLPSSP
jgi:hypothetical protein